MQKLELEKSLPELLEKLAQLNVGLTEEKRPGPDQLRKILQQRAQNFKDMAVTEEVGETLDILEFSLRNEHFALPLQWVGEVCRVMEITEIPGTPGFVKGVVNLRRKIYSVVDLAILLALPLPETANSVKPERTLAQDAEGFLLLTLVSDKMEFAVIIDSLYGVSTLPLQQLQGSLPTLSGTQADYFMGVTLDHLVVLDAEKLLLDKKLIVDG